MTVIRVKDLSLRTLIGFKPHEKKYKQDVIIQIEVEVNTSAIEQNDDYQAEDFFDYRSMTKSIIKMVEGSLANQLLTKSNLGKSQMRQL